MKVCPKCAQSFAEGFKYCPKDAAELVRYDLHAKLLEQHTLHFLLPSETLTTRLQRELIEALTELQKEPGAFLSGLLRGEGSNRRRKQLLQTGLAMAIIVYTAIFLSSVLIGLLTAPMAETAAKTEPWTNKNDPLFALLAPVLKKNLDTAKTKLGHLGGRLAQLRRAQGGGGGGAQTPASKGRQPMASFDPQIISLKPEPPKINQATLVLQPHVIADPKSFLKMAGSVGMPNHPTMPTSVGNGPGTGIGAGDGPGSGTGKSGGTGGNQFRPGGGTTTSIGNNDALMASSNLRPTILYKERASYTEDARQQKIQGTVVLSLVFGADGQIHAIRVVRQLSHGLTESAIEAAQRIRFAPATRNGSPVSVQMQIEYNFTLY